MSNLLNVKRCELYGFSSIQNKCYYYHTAATSMKWIKAKMEELGVMANDNYKLCFMMDSLAMITVDTGPKYGVIEVTLTFVFNISLLIFL